jgi:predicted acylesterase/phospholipase RssA
MSARVRLVVVVCLIAWISGCVDRKNCPGCMLADPLTVGCPYADSQIAATLSAATAPKVLVLSGGASHGAWGAGVISGWPDTGVAEPRPTFDIVTGISTGALQAPYAFLGSQYDDELEKFYTTTTNGMIYSWKPAFLLSNSLQDRAPLREILEDNVTEPAVLEVAAPANANRELYVGTINLDTSQFCPWNLSTIARKAASEPANSDARTCWVNLFRDAMFASAGAPVIAPPVEIDVNACKPGSPPPQKMLFADGGVRLRVFISKVVNQLPATSNPTIYVIMNGQLSTRPTCVSNRLLPITLRTYEIMDREALFGSLYALMHEHPSWKLRLSRIPDNRLVSLPAFEFDPARMSCMFDLGSSTAQGASPWETTVPPDAVANWPPGVMRPLQECAQPPTLTQLQPEPCPM